MVLNGKGILSISLILSSFSAQVADLEKILNSDSCFFFHFCPHMMHNAQ